MVLNKSKSPFSTENGGYHGYHESSPRFLQFLLYQAMQQFVLRAPATTVVGQSGEGTYGFLGQTPGANKLLDDAKFHGYLR